MSWGFFIDLRCTLPGRTWMSVKKKHPEPLPADWSGFTSKTLLKAFAPPESKSTFAKLLDEDDITVTVAKSAIRVFAHRDRSSLELGGVLAALLEAVAAAGESGELALVNDGTYSGEDGVLITRKAGAKKTKPKPLSDYEERLEALTSETAGDVANPFVVPATPPTKTRLTLDIVNRDAFAAYQRQDEAGARAVVEEFFDQGGERTPYLVRLYAITLRGNVEKDSPKVRERALDRLLQSFEKTPALRLDAPALIEAVAAGNENGRGKQTVEIVLQGLKEGLVMVPWLLINTTNSGCRAGSEALQPRLVEAFLPLLGKGSKMFAEPQAHCSHAELLRWKGDRDGAFKALKAAFAANPALRENLRSEANEWGEYVDDPRWKKIVG